MQLIYNDVLYTVSSSSIQFSELKNEVNFFHQFNTQVVYESKKSYTLPQALRPDKYCLCDNSTEQITLDSPLSITRPLIPDW